MSQITLESPATKLRSIVLRLFIIGVALGILALQFAMAFRAYVLASAEHTELWRQSDFISGAVCQDELILLIATSRSDGSSFEEVRCNLRTRSISRSDATTAMYHLVSDGQTLWRIPTNDRPKELSSQPFVWNGRPVQLVRTDVGTMNLLEFTDGSWRESDEYIFVPGASPWLNTATSIQNGHNVLQMAGYNDDSQTIEYCADVAVGTEKRVIELIDRMRSSRQISTESIFREAGWESAIFDTTKFALRRHSIIPGVQLIEPDLIANGIWFENNQLCGLRCVYQGELNDRLAGFNFDRFRTDQTIETRYVRSPIPFGLQDNRVTPHGILKVTTGNNADVYVVSVDDSDGRVHILQWKDEKLRLVAQRASPLVEQECRLVGRIVRDAIVAPTVILGLLLWFVERVRGQRMFSYGRQTALLASGVRRGIARMIDLALPVMALVASVVWHPDVTGWWSEVKWQWWWYVAPLLNPDTYPNRRTASDYLMIVNSFSSTLAGAPTITWLFRVGLLILLGQIIWQGRTGYTPGKWLMGIKVARTTLRPCGVARSLLREILLAVDSLMLLSWVPGCFALLTTPRSQRVGDMLSDTIVIRDRAVDVMNKDEKV